MIPRALEAEILRLHHTEHWPIGTIARQLRVHHGTVRRVLAQAGVPVAPQTRARRRWSSRTWRSSPRRWPSTRRCARRACTRWCASAVTPARPITSAPSSPACARARRPKRICACARLPGEQAQVDWAHFGKLSIGRALRPLMAFVMVLSYSRHLFLRFYLGASDGVLHPRPCRGVQLLPRRCRRVAALRQSQERRARAPGRGDPLPPHAARVGRPLPVPAPAGGRGARQREGAGRAGDSLCPRRLLRRAQLPRSRRSERPGLGLVRRARPPTGRVRKIAAAACARSSPRSKRICSPCPRNPFPCEERVDGERAQDALTCASTSTTTASRTRM